MSRDLEGRVALVTGSTDSIGYRVAENLAQRGARIALNGRSAERGEDALSRIREQCPEAVFFEGDASDYEAISRVMGQVEDGLGPIDILVSSGGSAKPGPMPFSEFKPEEMMMALEGRLLPRLYPVHAVYPGMRRRGSGSIVLVTSDAARHPTPGEAMIGAAGAALILLTKALAKEFAPSGVRVNCVALTLTAETSRYEDIFSREGFSKELFSKAVERFPMGRAPTSTEVAEVIGFLASPRSLQVSGQTISVNGGLSFGGW